MRPYVQRVGTAWSQFWNTVWWGNPDQSFSSRCWEARLLGQRWAFVAVPLVNLIMLSPTHCRAAYLSDDERTYSGGDR